MKRIFPAILCILFLLACSSQQKGKDSNLSETTVEQGIEDDTIYEIAPIDDSGEALIEDTITVITEEVQE